MNNQSQTLVHPHGHGHGHGQGMLAESWARGHRKRVVTVPGDTLADMRWHAEPQAGLPRGAALSVCALCVVCAKIYFTCGCGRCVSASRLAFCKGPRLRKIQRIQRIERIELVQSCGTRTHGMAMLDLHTSGSGSARHIIRYRTRQGCRIPLFRLSVTVTSRSR